jgi:hypothetical protein
MLANGLAELTPREAALVGHSLVEATLDELVRAACVTKPDSRIFEPGGLLGNYYALFTMSHTFGLIPSILRNDLEIIGTIRNAFGHSFNDIDFDSFFRKINEMCRGLRMPERYKEVVESSGLRFHGDPSSLGLLLVDEDGFIGAEALFAEDEVKSNRGRFLTSIRLVCVTLLALTLKAQSRSRDTSTEMTQPTSDAARG